MKLLVPTAGSVPAQEKADYVINIANMLDAEILAIHITESEEKTEGEKALEIFTNIANKVGVKISTFIKSGNVVSVISEIAKSEDVDLILMGASEGRVVAQWIAVDILEKSKVPIIIIPQGFEHVIDYNL